MKQYKFIIAVVILLIAFGFGYIAPAPKYKGSISMSTLFHIPEDFHGWKGTDISGSLGINWEEARFGFISDAIAYNFTNKEKGNLLFIVLNAGNFHHPKNCFTSSGYEIKELPDTEFQFPDKTVKAHTLFTKRGEDNFLNFYWIVINKNVAHEWVEQKVKQLYFSVLNQKRVGLMVRMDIPTDADNIDKATKLAKQFASDLNRSLETEHAEYIFGEL